MDYLALIKLLYPDIGHNEIEFTDDGQGIYISKWEYNKAQEPSIQELNAYSDQMDTYTQLEGAARDAEKHLSETDYKVIRIDEGYQITDEIKQKRELAREKIRAFRAFSLQEIH